MAILRFAFAIGVIGAVASSACSSSSGGSGTFSSGLPSSDTLSGLSDSDIQKLCGEISSFTDSYASNTGACNIAGYAAAAFSKQLGGTTDTTTLRQLCSAAVSQCQAQSGHIDAGVSASTCQKPSSTCTATVGDLEACLNDAKTAAQKEYAGIPSCSTLTAADLSLTDGSLSVGTASEPASCATLNQKCPDFASGSNSGSP